jgi:DNA recombination protein RmuC
MPTFLLILLVLVNAGLILAAIALYRRIAQSSVSPQIAALTQQTEALNSSLTQKFAAATADMAGRLEGTKGDLRQQVSDRLEDGFSKIRTSVEDQLVAGRREQAERLMEARTELTTSLALTTSQLKTEFDGLNQKTTQNLESIRDRVDQKLLAITDQVQQKLDQNIKEGFAQFEKVQQHLKAAEEQLREVGALGHSINDLNNLLKLPHLRGHFGEASLERLLSDFLPAHMFEMQAAAANGGGRVDAMIQFPDRRLPIDAKFPREQVLALFEGGDEAEIASARIELIRVMKAEAKRIKAYIQPEYGTTDIALMYLPSETLYMETVRNRELADWLNLQHVFPVSPNTLLMTLQTIALVHKWYEVARFLPEPIRKCRQEFEQGTRGFRESPDPLEKLSWKSHGAQRARAT